MRVRADDFNGAGWIIFEDEWSGMSGVSMPVTRPMGRALIVGQPDCRTAPAATLRRLGFTVVEIDEPYGAMAQLCKRPFFFSALILSLNSSYREEMQIVASVKRKFAHMEVWLADAHSRTAAVTDAMRLGADGLVAADGLHRVGNLASTSSGSMKFSPEAIAAMEADSPNPPGHAEMIKSMGSPTVEAVDRPADPLLTADELRALLQESPSSHSS